MTTESNHEAAPGATGFNPPPGDQAGLRAVTDQITCWRPATVGELLFNFWD
ncbi:hypothetical protein [Micromonospora sagamiensis]|uniref:Uncharacterized protein n=1 Tax=Micromonospora sagamiensis TaxID=47875 RepID=A0A562WNL3_9ACTN|nr:hypothetical protein [Micromonospora sagamiensis]TWJ31427.1 hypothetical protein JD81_04983 [Micromonospora sagamiensis]BCL15527.1 hypothetical protein GCM10017556_32660 [Micromonospora sagamiensis]